MPSAEAGSAVANSAGMRSVTLKGELGPLTKPATPISADDSGFLSLDTDSGNPAQFTWERRNGTYVNRLPQPFRLDDMWGINGGFGLEQVGATRSYRIRNYDTGKVVQFDLPAGDTATTVFAENRLMTLRKSAGKWTLHLLEIPAAGGRPVDRLVTGVPDTLPGTVTEALVDSRGAAIHFGGGGSYGVQALLDFATGRLTVVPDDGASATQLVSLSTTTVLYETFTDQPRYLVDRDHPDAPRTPLKDSPANLTLLGDWMVYPGGYGELLAQPAAGGTVRTLLPKSGTGPITGADGAVYVVGGSDSDDQAVRRITLDADGTPAVATHAPLPRQTVYDVGGVAVDHGQLRVGTLHVPVGVSRATTYLSGSSLSLTAGGTLNATPLRNVGDLGWHPAEGPRGDLQCTGECLRLVPTGEGDVVRFPRGHWVPTLSASGRYSVQRPNSRFQYVLDGTKELSHTAKWHAASLWGNQLWSAGRKSGTVSAVSLPSMKAVGPAVSVGAPCIPEEIQVVNRWIYWSCGPSGKAGVYDRTTKHVTTVPSGYAELADGYLVSQNETAAKLEITYFPGAVPSDRVGTSELGPLKDQVGAAADRRGRFWAVDRFGGPVAYLTDAGDVTVKWPRVTTSPLPSSPPTAPPAWIGVRTVVSTRGCGACRRRRRAEG
ncbi:hypothetical protein [Streptomyces sp. Y7]|uniref:hypothetical protein n=1 Tax=Streptomyces sp. Y7 TaxID=3342392 RepID=UPI0037109602